MSETFDVFKHVHVDVASDIINEFKKQHSIEIQPDPIQNNSVPTLELVIEDMKTRDNIGRQRYGVQLQANNGRDALVDAYQEALDLAVYLKQVIEERGKI